MIRQLAKRAGLTLEDETFDPDDVSWVLIEVIAGIGSRLAMSLRGRLGDVRLFTELHAMVRPWDYTDGLEHREPLSYPLAAS